MDLKEYYRDLRKKEAELEKEYPDGVVYITSLFHREKNSTPGSTCSARWFNAARAITDQTHRIATREEVQGFLQHQQDELKRNTQSEQRNKKQFIVVVDRDEPVSEKASPDMVAARAVENITKVEQRPTK